MSDPQEWKVGEVVTMATDWGECTRKVDGITAKGFLRVAGNLYDPKSGRLRGGGTWCCEYIHKATPEDVSRIKLNNIRCRLGEARWDSVSGPDVLAIWEIYKNRLKSEDDK